jgi:hypothetical protein
MDLRVRSANLRSPPRLSQLRSRQRAGDAARAREGAGNINALPDPTALSEDAFPGWRVYDPKVTTNVGQQGSTIQGEKVFERLLVPKTEGT